MEQLTLDEAAQLNADGWVIPTVGAIKGSFKAGAEWQKKQSKELIHLMRQLLTAYTIRYPDAKQLLVGYTNEAAFEKLNALIERSQD